MQTTKEISLVLVILAGLIGNIKPEDDPYRLPPNYVISHYDINLMVPAESFTENSNNYSGSVQITFQVTVETFEVKLHASLSNIELLTIQLDDATPLSNENYFVNGTTDILTLHFSTNLTVGQNYTLKITFNAHLVGRDGFYKVSYVDHNNKIQYLATTQFEITSTRKAFPCFDEPTFKATFALNLTYPSDMNALANTPSLENTTDPTTNLTTTQFVVTPRMSVYLVAFAISKYTCSEGYLEGSSNFIYRVCSRLDKEHERTWAMSLTPKVIDHLNSYTGFKYTRSISKLDQVAVAEKGGAMENWGLVIHGETALLFDNSIQTNYIKQAVASIISHELSHQWFGDLVTCKWWSETFLNEGFATMFEYYTTHYVLPDFEMEKQFIVRELQPILTVDGYQGVPALRSNASTQLETSDKFGGYTYSKGGSVLRMIEHVVGRDNFKAGVQKYLADNAYKPVEPQDLWDALENVTENSILSLPTFVTLSQVVDNWINKGGYPVLNVSLVDTTIHISQQRFLYEGTDNENSLWYVPVTFSTAATADNNEVTTPKGWVTPTDDYVIEGFSNASQWIVVNNQQTGFYRVNYDATLWANLATALKQSNFSGIHVSNRAQIVDDAYNLALAGRLKFGEMLKIVEFLENEDSYITWFSAVNLISYLLQKTGSTTTLGVTLTNHFLKLMSGCVQSVPLSKVNETNQIFTLNQVLINEHACKFGNPACVSAAKELFAKYKNSYVRPNINTRPIVYCNAIRYSDNPVEDWNFLYGQYQNVSIPEDSSTIWTALGCATNITVLNEFLSKTLTIDTVITSSLYMSVFTTIYSANEIGVDVVLEFFIVNHQAITDVFFAAGFDPAGILFGMGSFLTKVSQIEKLEHFLNTTSGLSEGIVNAGNIACAVGKSNQEIVNSYKSSLYAYFELPDEEANSTTTSTLAPITTTTPNPNRAVTLEKKGLFVVLLIGLINILHCL